MPWSTQSPMEAKLKFITEWLSGVYSVAELARRHHIVAKTAFKYINRYQQYGLEGLYEQSRAPLQPATADDELIERCVALKKDKPVLGPRKIRLIMEREYPEIAWPAASTLGEHFKKRSLVKLRKKRRRTPPRTQPFRDCLQPNDTWSIDFKGDFRLGTGERCYPLTLSDNFSRYLVGCDALLSTRAKGVFASMERLFKEYGLPKAIRSDNGSPFASTGLAGLSRLSVWWIKLGIEPERIDPGSPAQNGRHERLHRTLKEVAIQPPKTTKARQQQAFNEFKQEYNEYRPHEALGGACPADRYECSKRSYPSQLEEISYDEDKQVRRVRSNGEIKWKGGYVYISQSLIGEPVGLQEIEGGGFLIYYSSYIIGVLNALTLKAESLSPKQWLKIKYGDDKL